MQTQLSYAVDRQQIEYSDVNAVTISVENEFRSSGASAKAIETLLSVTRKLKGQRSSKLKPPAEGKSAEIESISVSQLSYANRANNFEAMLLALQAEPKYNPHDVKISLIGLKKKYQLLIKS